MYYVILKGIYSDKHIVAVTCDKQKAEKLKECYSDSHQNARIEEWEESNVNLRNYYYIEYDVFNNDYDISKISQEDIYDDISKVIEFSRGSELDVYVQADNEDLALKIARDLFTEYKAKKEGLV